MPEANRSQHQVMVDIQEYFDKSSDCLPHATSVAHFHMEFSKTFLGGAPMLASVFRSYSCALLVLFASHSANATTVFDFNDFPEFPDPGLIHSPLPNTFLYQCGGKEFCSHIDVFELNDDDFGLSVRTVREGIAITLDRSGRGYGIRGDIGRVNTDGPFEFHPFIADFDTDLSSVSVASSVGMSMAPHIADPFDPVGGGEVWTLIELWSDPRATGDMVASRVITVADWLADPSFSFDLGAPAGQSFRSVRFGSVWHLDPHCLAECGFLQAINESGFTSISVTPVPQPSTTLLMGLGLVGLAAAGKRK